MSRCRLKLQDFSLKVCYIVLYAQNFLPIAVFFKSVLLKTLCF